MVDTTNDFTKLVNPKDYPKLSSYTHPVKKSQRKIIGREIEMRQILATFDSPELSNVILLAEGGGGKTALVQGLMEKDPDRIYLEVQLSRMLADAGDNPDKIAEWLRNVFDESSKYGKANRFGVVLFIDEFHQIAEESAAAVEVLKPMLADSGQRGIHFIAATTYEEFKKYISSNQPLVERLKAIRLSQPNETTVMSILTGMAKKYNVYDKINDPERLFKLIYEYTNRYVPSQIQPRKSIRVLDSMIGYYRSEHSPIDTSSLARVLYDQQGVNVTFKAKAEHIEKELKKHVLQQPIAIASAVQRLQICIADLNDKTKPMASLLFSGPTGVGKTEMAKQLAKLLLNDSQLLIRFDMTEFSTNDTMETFRNELTQAVWAHPYCILLLDEIEKACKPVTRLLLQVLDDGRLSDVNGRTVSFINTYIVMTTNAAHEVYARVQQYQDQLKDPREYLRTYESLIREAITNGSSDSGSGGKFPPELLGRIDQIVPFEPLTHDTKDQITKIHLATLVHELHAKYKIKAYVSPDVITYINGDMVSQTDADAGGAREILHKLQSEVVSVVASFINNYPQIKTINIIVKGQMAYTSKNHRISHAHIEVHAVRPKKQKQNKKQTPQALHTA